MTDEGILFNWERSFDVYGKKNSNAGTRNLRYAELKEKAPEDGKLKNRQGRKANIALGVIAILLILVSVVVAVTLYLVLRRVKKTL
jgi:hypothetical protein